MDPKKEKKINRMVDRKTGNTFSAGLAKKLKDARLKLLKDKNGS